MTDAFLVRLEKGAQFVTFILYGPTVITITGDEFDRQISLFTYDNNDIARNGIAQSTSAAERNGMDLYRVYGCRDSFTLMSKMQRAKDAYGEQDYREAEKWAKSISSSIIASSVILYPTSWAGPWKAS